MLEYKQDFQSISQKLIQVIKIYQKLCDKYKINYPEN